MAWWDNLVSTGSDKVIVTHNFVLMESIIEEDTRAIFNRFLEILKEDTPVKTGALRESERLSLSRWSENFLVYHLYALYYFTFVDEGTIFIKPRRFSRRALKYLYRRLRGYND